MTFLKKFLIFLLLPLFAFSAHKYYLSLTEINYNPKEKSFQIVMNVFMDDIELALNKKYEIDLQLTTKKELKDNDVYFKKYLKEYFSVAVNNQNTDYLYLGKEYDGNIVYFYLEILNIENIKTVTIKNEVLIKNFEKQQNLIKVNVGANKKSKLLTKDNSKTVLKF